MDWICFFFQRISIVFKVKSKFFQNYYYIFYTCHFDNIRKYNNIRRFQFIKKGVEEYNENMRL